MAMMNRAYAEALFEDVSDVIDKVHEAYDLGDQPYEAALRDILGNLDGDVFTTVCVAMKSVNRERKKQMTAEDRELADLYWAWADARNAAT